MTEKLNKLFKKLKKQHLSREQESRADMELDDERVHYLPVEETSRDPFSKTIYEYNDIALIQNRPFIKETTISLLKSIDKLLERDKQREKDGFPRKIRMGRLIKPGRGGKDKVVVVPSTVEEKLIHDRLKDPNEETTSGGTGEGEEGEVIGEQEVHDPEKQGEGGAGQGESGQHELESSAYDLGKILTEKF